MKYKFKSSECIIKAKTTTTASDTNQLEFTSELDFTTEPCIEEWTSWSDYDSCAERGPGPFKKLRHRSKFHSAACNSEGYGVEYQYEFQYCDNKRPNGFLGTGKYSIKVNQT